MEAFGDFHDACLREVHLWTQHWVDERLSMNVSPGPDTRLRMLVQRQWRSPAAVELLFEEIERFCLVGAPENHDSIIMGASLLVREDGIYWSPERDWSPEGPRGQDASWVRARRLSWRAVDWLGPGLRYGPPGEVDE